MAVFAVVENGMALHEGASPRVLPGHANGGALGEQRAEREQFAESPVDRAAAAHLDALLQQPLQLAVHAEALWRVVVRVADELDDALGNSRRLRFMDAFCITLGVVGRREAVAGVFRDHRDRRGLRGVGFCERLLEARLEVCVGTLVLFLGDVAASNQRFCVEGSNAALRLDEVVHERLGHRGVVALVVSATAVADDVDDDVTLELLPIVESELRHTHYGFWVVAVDMKDRRLNCLGNVGGVLRGAALTGRRSEADLVVDHDVHRAASAVRAQLRHLQNLDHDALTGHRRVAVHHDRQHRERANRSPVLLGTNNAFKHAVDSLEVRGVCGEVDRNRRAVGRREGTLCAEVVLDVARTLNGLRVLGSFKLAKDLAVGLACNVRQHIEASPVRHAYRDLFELGLCCTLNHGIEGDDRRLSAFETEALLADVLGLKEGFESLTLVELAENAHLLVVGRLFVRLLDALLEPAPLCRVLNVHVLDTDGAAIRVAQHAENLAQQHRAATAEAGHNKFTVEVPEGEAVA